MPPAVLQNSLRCQLSAVPTVICPGRRTPLSTSTASSWGRQRPGGIWSSSTGGSSSGGRLCTLGLLGNTFVLGGTLARSLLGGKAGTALGKGLLLCGRDRLDGIIVRIGIVIDGSLLGLDRSRSSLAYRIDDLGLNDSRHLFLRLAELTDGTADRAAHLRELIRAKQQKAEDHDDCQLTLSNTKHTYLQGSM